VVLPRKDGAGAPALSTGLSGVHQFVPALAGVTLGLFPLALVGHWVLTSW